MKFTDFESNPQELVGKLVLYESGGIHGGTTRKITKITKVTKTAFKIEGEKESIFSLINGHKKGLTGRMNWGVVSDCTLITEEEAESLRKKWAENKEKKALLADVTEKLKTATLTQLQGISKILNQ
jgi:hypothetical protein